MSGFQINFPVWVIGIDNPSGEGFKIAGVTDEELGSWLPVFTDTDLASRFLELSICPGDASRRTIEIENVQSFRELVGKLSRSGCQHVVFDYSLVGPNVTGSLVSVKDVLDECDRKAI
jgi:hypothetical protein